ncbi:MAG: DUF1289 domain-containing protein [Methylococcales bacterium]|nr:DUF1289 domain-containing protein [Methylococcales bacterium]MBT7444419.1 DUF1289 domain-containing protein [Methylococcales bacterium]
MANPPQNTETTIPSPCIRNCCLDEEDVCLGCFRSVDEITQWGAATATQRLEILKQAKIRQKNKPPYAW